jgi:hypothetical protein
MAVWEKFFLPGCLPVNPPGYAILSGRNGVFGVLSVLFI